MLQTTEPTQDLAVEDHPNRTRARRSGTPAVSGATLSAYSTDWPLYYPLPHSGAVSVAPVAVPTSVGEVAAAHIISDDDYLDHLDSLPDWECGDGWSDES